MRFATNYRFFRARRGFATMGVLDKPSSGASRLAALSRATSRNFS